MDTRPFKGRVPCPLKVTVHDDVGMAADDAVAGVTGGTKHTAGSSTPDSDTKLTCVPGGTGLP